jgi:RND family efflux transporter MFP subunit
MKKPHLLRWTLLSAVVVAASAAFLGAGESRPTGHMGVAKPSEESNVTFPMAGKISEILVKEGQEVKEGEVMARLLATKEERALAIAVHKASSTVQIEAEEAVKKQKEADLARLVAAGSAVSKTETQAAGLEVTVAEARIALAKHQHAEDVLSKELQEIALDWTQLKAPFTGVVERLLAKRAEGTDGVNRPVIRLIKLDPLWIEVPVPIAEAQRLKKDDAATILFAQTNERRSGKVLQVFPTVETGSQTILVRIEVPNPQKTQSGGIVHVTFGPQNVAQN